MNYCTGTRRNLPSAWREPVSRPGDESPHHKARIHYTSRPPPHKSGSQHAICIVKLGIRRDARAEVTARPQLPETARATERWTLEGVVRCCFDAWGWEEWRGLLQRDSKMPEIKGVDLWRAFQGKLVSHLKFSWWFYYSNSRLLRRFLASCYFGSYSKWPKNPKYSRYVIIPRKLQTRVLAVPW